MRERSSVCLAYREEQGKEKGSKRKYIVYGPWFRVPREGSLAKSGPCFEERAEALFKPTPVATSSPVERSASSAPGTIHRSVGCSILPCTRSTWPSEAWAMVEEGRTGACMSSGPGSASD